MSKVVSLFEAAKEAREHFEESPHRSRPVTMRMERITYAMLQKVAAAMGEKPSSCAAILLNEALQDCFDAAGWDYKSSEAVMELYRSFEPAAPLGLGPQEEG